jgi:hypothetical protein
MTLLRVVTATATLIIASALGVSPAWAASPTNDTSSGATAASAGFSEVLDTTEATTDAQDTQFDESCGFLKTDASVWYTFQGNDADIVVDAYGGGSSTYDAGVLIGVGSPGSLQAVACYLRRGAFHADAGTTYYILVVDPQYDQDTTYGGILHMSFSAVPPPTVTLTVNAKGTASKSTGAAHITGSYTCTNGGFTDALFGTVAQTIKQRVPVSIYANVSIYPFNASCNGVRHTWAIDVFPDSGGAFRTGPATVDADLTVCGEFNCAGSQVHQIVKLALVN